MLINMLYYCLVSMMLLILLQLFNYLGQNGVMVSTSFMYYQESNDKNTFELMPQSHAHKLQSILCEKGKVLADITCDTKRTLLTLVLVSFKFGHHFPMYRILV